MAQRNLDRPVTVRLTPAQARKLHLAAAVYGITVSDVVRKFLEPLFDLSEEQIIIGCVVSEVMEGWKKITGRR